MNYVLSTGNLLACDSPITVHVAWWCWYLSTANLGIISSCLILIYNDVNANGSRATHRVITPPRQSRLPWPIPSHQQASHWMPLVWCQWFWKVFYTVSIAIGCIMDPVATKRWKTFRLFSTHVYWYHVDIHLQTSHAGCQSTYDCGCHPAVPTEYCG